MAKTYNGIIQNGMNKKNLANVKYQTSRVI